jgi:hypothetical protein
MSSCRIGSQPDQADWFEVLPGCVRVLAWRSHLYFNLSELIRAIAQFCRNIAIIGLPFAASPLTRDRLLGSDLLLLPGDRGEGKQLPRIG